MLSCILSACTVTPGITVDTTLTDWEAFQTFPQSLGKPGIEVSVHTGVTRTFFLTSAAFSLRVCTHSRTSQPLSALLSRYLVRFFPSPVFVPQGARVPYQLHSKQTAAGSVRLLGICLGDRERRREREVGGEQKTGTRSGGGEVRHTGRNCKNLKWGSNRGWGGETEEGVAGESVCTRCFGDWAAERMSSLVLRVLYTSLFQVIALNTAVFYLHSE